MKKIYFLFLLLFTFTSAFSQLEGTTWKLAPTAEALAVGPAKGDFSWWSNSAEDVSTRACFFDDRFVFNADGSFSNIQDGETWLEGWQGSDPEGCGTSVAPHDGSATATWAYDAAAGTVTLTGTGAHLGLAKVHNGGELGSPADAPESITYPVVIDGTTMTIDIDFGGIGFWHFVFEQVTGADPEPTSPVAGIWKLAPIEQALAVGPTKGDFSWWSNGASDVEARACLFDDQFVFNADGTFSNTQDGMTWLEGWQGMDPEGCGTPVAPHDGSNAATWSYDEAAGTITLTGTGAHLGLAKVHNGGELASPADAPESITYPIVFEENRMIVDIDFGGIGFWHFVLQKADGTEPEPEPMTSNVAFSVDMNDYVGDFTAVNVSGNFNDWSGDSNPLSDEDGDGIWNGTIALAEGNYEYKFTLDNWAVQESFAGGEDCTVTAGDFTNRSIAVSGDAEVCFKWNTCDACGEGQTGGGEPVSLEGTWKLAPIAQALAVGPTKGDFSWWSNGAGDVATRACLFDDQFVFNADGTFNNVQGDETWLEAWQGMDPEGCGAPVAPHNGSNAATWSFDEAAGTVTLTGVGAHLGLAKVHNGGELGSPADAPASITYPMVIEGNRMTIDIDFGGIGFWHFVLDKVAETEPEPEPELTGVMGTWKLAPMAQALAVGPTKGDFSWWSNNAGDVSTRACLFDDKFVFNADGTFNNVQDGETWLEGWQGMDPEGCGASVAPHDGSNAATWAYDEAAGTVTLTGVGAHLGLAKVHNGGELGSPSDAPESITYPVVLDGNTMTIDIDFGGIGFWHFVLEREITSSTVQVVKEDLFNFFPNPANSQIQIQSNEVIDELTIHDIAGKVLVKRINPSSYETIDVSGLTSGLYIIQCRVGYKVSVEKLSIK